MQSSVIYSAISGTCCCGSSLIKSAVSSSVGTADGCTSYSLLGVRQRGKLANAIALRADKKPSSGRLGRRCDGIVSVRAERAGGGGSWDEKVKDLNSEKAVQGFDRSARQMVDDLKPAEHPGTTSPRDIELQAEEKAFETDESFGGKESVLEVASDSAVEPEHAHEHTVATAGELGPKLGQSVEDLTTTLEDKAEVASNRDAELLKTDEGTGEWTDGVGQVVDVSKDSGVTGEEDRATDAEPGEVTREAATEKILDIAREGIEVLKWAAEGVMAAGANSREGFQVAKDIIDKRLKSFNIAAEETREVSAQLSEVAKKKYEEMQGSANKFNEELQVQIEDKKAVDELKPDSETSPLAQLSRGVQDTIGDATKEDGPLAKLGQTLQENVAKLSTAGQKVASNSSQGITEQSKLDSHLLVPVGEKEGYFQDLAPANGSSPKPGDRSTEASDILGQDNVIKEEGGEQGDRKKYEGFFGDIPVDRLASSSKDDTEQTLTTSGDASASKGEEDQKKYEGFFGDIPVDPSTSSSKADTEQSSTVSGYAAMTKEQNPSVSGNASATMKDGYEHELRNDQLKETQQSGQEASNVGASSEYDPAAVQPSVKGKDEMGIGPDE